MQKRTTIAWAILILFELTILLIIVLFVNKISFHRKNAGMAGNENISTINRVNNCGPVALKMIFDHYKILSNLNEIESHIIRTDVGTSMLSLREMSEFKGLHAEGWRLTLADLPRSTFPLILFVNDNHFIVADSVTQDTLYFRDTLNGAMKLSLRKLSEKWKGETLLFKR
jgi:ABC-type bacteriocin/lantibiotic exporter with double-glycine peptidase domain